MKGITPVIAIILLLLMAVAAAGGFYFVYQQFSSSGEESGSSQIEALGEQSLTQLSIESVHAGKVYVKNVGASAIDATKLTVYVENVPVEVNLSTTTLAENGRATLKFTSVPSCTGTKCEVRVSGAAGASRSVEAAKLSCASDGECSYGESCSSGVCISSEVEEGECEWYVGEGCGDCVCSGSENGRNCYVDCAPRQLLSMYYDLTSDDPDYIAYLWNGTSYEHGYNVTNTTYVDFLIETEYDSQGNALAVGYNLVGPGNIIWSQFDGEGWSLAQNLTDYQDRNKDAYTTALDFNSSDNAITVWYVDGDGYENVAWASWDGSDWSEPENLTDPGDFDIATPDFAFADNDKGMAVWTSTGGGWWYAANYSLWDNGWVESGTINEVRGANSPRPSAVEFNSTHAMAVWRTDFDGFGKKLQWATYSLSESSWSGPQNLTDFSDDQLSGVGSLQIDDNENWVLLVGRDEETWTEWYSWNDGWVDEGNLTFQNLPGSTFVTKSEHNTITAVNLQLVGTEFVEHFSYWTGSGWTDFVEMG